MDPPVLLPWISVLVLPIGAWLIQMRTSAAVEKERLATLRRDMNRETKERQILAELQIENHKTDGHTSRNAAQSAASAHDLIRLLRSDLEHIRHPSIDETSGR